jgi:hypothetical protein
MVVVLATDHRARNEVLNLVLETRPPCVTRSLISYRCSLRHRTTSCGPAQRAASLFRGSTSATITVSRGEGGLELVPLDHGELARITADTLTDVRDEIRTGVVRCPGGWSNSWARLTLGGGAALMLRQVRLRVTAPASALDGAHACASRGRVGRPWWSRGNPGAHRSRWPRPNKVERATVLVT